MTMITPTVGRVVHFISALRPDDPMAAIVTYVHDDRCVNLAAFGEGGHLSPKTSVQLVQPGDDAPTEGEYCTWMPYQLKKETGSESGEKDAGTQTI